MTWNRIIMNEEDHQRLTELMERTPQEHREHYQDLRRKLESARCLDATEIPADVVTMGSTAVLRELDSDDIWTFTLAYPAEANIDEDRISILSPVGTAIIGQRVGDVVDWPVPSGTVKIRIEDLIGQPEAAGIGESPNQLIR